MKTASASRWRGVSEEKVYVTVDAHCHVGTYWYEPVETLKFQLDRYGVERAVLVQMWNELDNSYQEQCVQEEPGRFASVVAVDVTSADAPRAIAEHIERGAVGVRLRPNTLSAGDDPWAIWRACADHGTTVSCVGSPANFASRAFADVVAAHPTVPIVIEHIAEVLPLSDEYDAEEAQHILDLAEHPNVHMKFHGFGEFAQRLRNPGDGFPFVRPVPDWMRRSIDAFGPERMMWGSDYPPVSKREGYGNALTLVRDDLADFSDAERELMFGGVAERLYWGSK